MKAKLIFGKKWSIVWKSKYKHWKFIWNNFSFVNKINSFIELKFALIFLVFCHFSLVLLIFLVARRNDGNQLTLAQPQEQSEGHARSVESHDRPVDRTKIEENCEYCE